MADITQHAKILVQTKGEPELMPFGDEIHKVGFSGVENETTKSYHAFRFKDNSEVVDAIVVGEVLDADYETIVKGEYTNYKVVQVYRDGQPVFAKSGGFKGGRGGYGKSPEEREEIARAVALKVAVGNTPEGTTPAKVITEATKYLDFLRAPKTADPKVSEPALKSHGLVTSSGDVVTRDALKGLAALARELNVATDWLKAAALRLYGKGDIKTITETELSDLTDKLGIEAERLKEESPF